MGTIPVFNVKDSPYNCKGDGLTNDYTGLQSAINDVLRARGILHVPIGLYITAGQLNAGSGIQVWGTASSQTRGAGSCIRGVTANLDVFRFTNTSNETSDVVMKSLRIEGPWNTTGSGVSLKNTGSNGTHPPFTYFHFEDMYIADFYGAGASGMNIEGAIVSKFERIVCESCTNGFYSNGQATGTPFSTTATSLSFDTCYANGCQAGSGFKLYSTVYTSMNNCAADSCGIAYDLTNCNGLTLNACGSEYGSNDTATPGVAFKINHCSQLTLNSPYVFQNQHTGFWVTGNSQGIVFVAPQENSPLNAQYSSRVDAGSSATFISPGFTSPRCDLGAVKNY